MNLTEAEKRDPLWLKIKAHYTTKLDELRKQNDSYNLGELDSARLRGRIKEIKFLLDVEAPNSADEE